MSEVPTLGRAISEARKAKGLSQKDLAARIKREEGDGSISPQYLNDIEHDRRSPSSDHMIQEFSRELGLSENFLFFLANRFPPELRKLTPQPDVVDRVVAHAAVAFRQSPPAFRKR
jgi:transcriptional regulator with XRE-family HTH domain